MIMVGISNESIGLSLVVSSGDFYFVDGMLIAELVELLQLDRVLLAISVYVLFLMIFCKIFDAL